MQRRAWLIALSNSLTTAAMAGSYVPLRLHHMAVNKKYTVSQNSGKLTNSGYQAQPFFKHREGAQNERVEAEVLEYYNVDRVATVNLLISVSRGLR